MCKCNCNETCPKCDPGIEAFYQEKVKEAKAMTAAHFEAISIYYPFEDNLDAKDIWYEYCQMRDQEAAEEAAGDGDPSQWDF
jgi:hypothetical protein